MPEPRRDPLEALRTRTVPVAPDPAFALSLRARIADALADRAQAANPAGRTRPADQEATMEPITTDIPVRRGLSRNGARAGDISYVSLGVPDTARARQFYAAVLEWRFGPGGADDTARVDDVIPEVGVWSGAEAHGAVLAFRVDDLAATVALVRSLGGRATDVETKPYGLSSDCEDDQGLPFYLHQLPAADRPAPANGSAQGDVSYISLLVDDAERARSFFGAVLGWRFSPTGPPGGWNVEGPSPMIGMAGGRPGEAGAVMSYLVDDIAAAVARVREAGGTAIGPVMRPYGLEADCQDDQGIAFYLHEFPPAT